MNPLFNQFGNSKNIGMPQSVRNFNNMLSQFNQFKSTFQGNPKDQVMKLLSSGKMSQDQFKQLQEMASQLQNLFR